MTNVCPQNYGTPPKVAANGKIIALPKAPAGTATAKKVHTTRKKSLTNKILH
jgi:hypothetical protein